MMLCFFWIVLSLAALVFVGYMVMWCSAARRRLFLPTDVSEHGGHDPAYWPPVAIVVPARNEADTLEHTLPTWLAQDYPNLKKVLLVDDRSDDLTGARALELSAKTNRPELLEVLTNAPLPKKWAGKVWAMNNGLEAVLQDESIEYVLLTDADIAHKPDSLRKLVRQSENKQLGFNSRMARLQCESFAEKWLIPPFLYFFLLLYPLRKANDPRCRMASGAGGCVLLSREAIRRLGGGLHEIKDCIIDDVNLAKAVKRNGLPIHLSLSVHTVKSTRPYPRVRDIAKMVNRSAYCQLNYNPLLLSLTLLVMGIVFIVPTIAIILGSYSMKHPHAFTGEARSLWLWSSFLTELGLAALILQMAHFKQALDFFNLNPWRMFTFPLAGLAYATMTLQSALRHWTRKKTTWREKE